jgi:hypothetical protein
MAPERRTATLLAFAQAFERTAMDDAIDLFDALVSDIVRGAPPRPSLPIRAVSRPWHEETPEARPEILSGRSRLRSTARRLAVRHCGVLPPRAGGAAGAASEPRPPTEAGGGDGGAKRALNYLYTRALTRLLAMARGEPQLPGLFTQFTGHKQDTLYCGIMLIVGRCRGHGLSLPGETVDK